MSMGHQWWVTPSMEPGPKPTGQAAAALDRSGRLTENDSGHVAVTQEP